MHLSMRDTGLSVWDDATKEASLSYYFFHFPPFQFHHPGEGCNLFTFPNDNLGLD